MGCFLLITADDLAHLRESGVAITPELLDQLTPVFDPSRFEYRVGSRYADWREYIDLVRADERGRVLDAARTMGAGAGQSLAKTLQALGAALVNLKQAAELGDYPDKLEAQWAEYLASKGELTPYTDRYDPHDSKHANTKPSSARL